MQPGIWGEYDAHTSSEERKLSMKASETMDGNIDGKTRISVVIPVYRGAQSIGQVVEELIAALDRKYALEIVLVNDNSPDQSEEVCVALFHKYPDTVRFFSLAKNVGEHNAVMAGLNQASGDYMVIMDDDLQNPISSVEKLLDYAIRNDCDVTYTYYRKKHHSLFRNFCSSLNDLVADVMLKKPKGLYLSSFKALNRFIVNEIIQYDLPYPYVDGLVLRTTDKIARIEVEHLERRIGRSGYTLTKLIRLWLNMFTSFSILPLRASVLLGLMMAFLGSLFGVATLIEKMTNPNVPVGYTMIVELVLICSGVQLVSLGVIGEYIGRVFLSLNKKPQYTIRKRFEKRAPGKGEARPHGES
jgi:undecaprenyl-phosphate 4-deoxy-4-formamido-L-arabinose transferase